MTGACLRLRRDVPIIMAQLVKFNIIWIRPQSHQQLVKERVHNQVLN